MPTSRAPAGERRSPMPHVELQILLQLAARPCHGYEMMKSIAAESDGRQAPGPGTLYVALRRLNEAELIEESGRPAARSRRRYRLTRAGRSALDDELHRLAEILTQARNIGWRLSARRSRS